MKPIRRQHPGAASIATALDAGESIRLLMVREGRLSPAARDVLARCKAADVSIRKAGQREMKRMSAAGEQPELLALVGPDPNATLEEVLATGGAVWLLTGVAYPGNAGFAIRTAEVSGAAGIVLDASFDREGRRQALRASMRADRLFPVLWASADEVLELARDTGYRLVGIEDQGKQAPWETDLSGPTVFVVGGEAGGVASSLLERCDTTIRIPMTGFIQSYNLQAALAIVAGERLRQGLLEP
ncbi:MAG: RNA methyltransferase [Myxococcota bacterium]|nr:RNA methyltransferase [Myxococcota bacterium]